MLKRKELKNIVYVFLSNFMLIFVGIFTGFVVPKLLGVTDYGLYKIFNLYTTYVVFCDFGLANGMYLKYGGYTRENIPKDKFRCFFRILLVLQVIWALIISLIAFIWMNNEYKFIFISIAVYLIFNNVSNYYEKISIALGELRVLSIRNIVKSVFTIISIVALWIALSVKIPLEKYRIYIILFNCVYVAICMQYIWTYKDISFGNKESKVIEKEEVIEILSGGFVLLVADMVASLILTLDRQFISIFYDIDTYSIYSFAYSILKIIILAVSAISSILYPSLKRMGKEEMVGQYDKSLTMVGVISLFCVLSYYPLRLIVEVFLDEYVMSIPIFQVLLPAIVINLIISLLIVNYIKALNKQNVYFLITVIVLVISIVLNFGAQLILKKPIGIAEASVVTMLIWYKISDSYVRRFTSNRKYFFDIYLFLNIAIYYVLTSIVSNLYICFFANAAFFIILTLIFYKKEIIEFLNNLKG